jgi:hypothetical protein
MKPMPVASPWIMRDKSAEVIWTSNGGANTNRVAPSATGVCVRPPAGLPVCYRWMPITAQNNIAASNRRRVKVEVFWDGDKTIDDS